MCLQFWHLIAEKCCFQAINQAIGWAIETFASEAQFGCGFGAGNACFHGRTGLFGGAIGQGRWHRRFKAARFSVPETDIRAMARYFYGRFGLLRAPQRTNLKTYIISS